MRDLQTLISRFTGVLPDKQFLFFEGVKFEEVIDSNTPARDWPNTSPEKPFVMVTEDNKLTKKLEKPPYCKE